MLSTRENGRIGGVKLVETLAEMKVKVSRTSVLPEEILCFCIARSRSAWLGGMKPYREIYQAKRTFPVYLNSFMFNCAIQCNDKIPVSFSPTFQTPQSQTRRNF